MATIPLPASAGNPFEALERLHALHERGRTGGPLWLLDDFMFMGYEAFRACPSVTGPRRIVQCQAYKHSMSRKYLYVDAGGGCYIMDRYRYPEYRSYVHAITWVLDGWTSAKMNEALSVYRGLRADLKAVQP